MPETRKRSLAPRPAETEGSPWSMRRRRPRDHDMKREAVVRVKREGKALHEGKLVSLRREKDEAREVREGFECGINLGNFQDVKVDDVIETFEMREKPRA